MLYVKSFVGAGSDENWKYRDGADLIMTVLLFF